MSIPTPRAAFADLKRHIKAIDARFLQPHIGLVKPPKPSEQLDLDAYAVLCHAALEQFFEELSAWLLHRTIDNWTTRSRAGGATVGLALRYTNKIEWESEEAHFDRIRDFLDAHVRKEHSKVIGNNHGTGIDYLVSILCPLGVDLPKDANLRNSLDALVRVRGERAHKNRLGAKIVKSPGDLQTMVRDCVDLAEAVRDRVLAAK